MTKTLTINYDVNPTKEAEISILAKLVATFEHRPDMYLADLFTPELLEHATIAINNDFAPNVIASLAAANQRADKAEADLHEQTLATANAENRAKIWAAQAEATKREMQTKLDELQFALDCAADDAQTARLLIAHQEGQIAELQAAELQLKAHLYDLMMAAAAQ